MHIGLVIYGSINTLSGGYLYDRQLVRALETAGHRVSIFSTPWRTYPRHLGDNANRTWRNRLLHAPVDLWLQDELNHPSLFWVNRTLRRSHPAPIVSIVHHLRSSEDHPTAWRTLYRQVERHYLATVDVVLANSYTTLSTVGALLGSSLPAHVAWPAASHLPVTAEIEPAAIVARTLLSERLRILFVGNVIPRKGLHHLLDALAGVESPWELSVVGQASPFDGYTNAIHRQVRALGLGARVRFVGRVSDGELVDLYRRHHLFVAPSYEGFGIVYLEAQRFGLPVIALTCGAAREVIIDGQSGVLVPPAQTQALATAIHQFAADSTLLANMGLAARLRYMLHPTWEASMAGAVRWLEKVIRRKA